MKKPLFFLAGIYMLMTLAPLAAFAYEFDISKNPDFVELFSGQRIQLDIRYATSNNFVGRAVYPSARTYLHRDASAKFQSALNELERTNPGYKFNIFDGLRPRSVQWVLWNAVKGTANQKYVANPVRGSVHNYGFALDVSIADAHGNELDMGTGFDDFTALSEPQNEDVNVRLGKLTHAQLNNRLLLRRIMTHAGFHPLATEWWHFDALDRAELNKNYKIIE